MKTQNRTGLVPSGSRQEAIQSLLDLGLIIREDDRWLDAHSLQPIEDRIELLTDVDWDWTKQENFLWLRRNWNELAHADPTILRRQLLLLRFQRAGYSNTA